MKLSEFILLSEPEKKQEVLHQGVLVGKRKTATSIIFLFQMEGYYVETYFSLANKAVEEYHAFADTRALTPYLELIGLGNLIH